jgi:4-amino-4-deoxy-L-arabinose transferase-like glycosyltransferase
VNSVIRLVSRDARWQDAACILSLAVLTALLLLPLLGTLPMVVWDESRNANNAIEMMRGGNWLVTMFDGVPDHWNTKPPLLIWMIAALLKAGFNPMLALRLPSAIATVATVLALFAFCRWVLLDQVAGMLAALLLLSSELFFTLHVARTGDYDALLSLFTTLAVLASWVYVDGEDRWQGRAVWAIAASLLLGILTKGVAVLMIGPGLLAYVIARGRLRATLGDGRVWAAGCIVLVCSALYYGGREMTDPGYLAAVWNNDVGGRYVTVLDRHSEGPFYYVAVLLRGFEPGMLALPASVLSLTRGASRSRGIVLLCLLVTAFLLAVLSFAGTKIYWYAAPLVPLLSLATGVSLAHGFVLLLRRQQVGRPQIRAGLVRAAMVVVLSVGLVRNFSFSQVQLVDEARDPRNAQRWYATMLGQKLPEPHHVVIVDHGIPNDAGFAHYHPIATFYRDYAQAERIVSPGAQIGPAEWVVTCDRQALEWLAATYGFVAQTTNRWCAMGRIAARHDGGAG